MKTIVWSATATKQLDALPLAAQVQVERGIEDYARSGSGDVMKLSGRDTYRLRIGRYRVILDEDSTTVLAISISKRDSQTYRRH